MCPCIKFQSLDFAQICPKLFERQNLEKLNIKNCNKDVAMYPSIKFGELQILRPNLPKKHFRVKY